MPQRPLLALLLAACGAAGVQAGYRGGVCHPSGVFPSHALAIRALQPCALWASGSFDGGAGAAAWSPPCRDFNGSRFRAGVWSGDGCRPEFPPAAVLRAFLAGKRLLVQGDSMLRHLFNRLVFYLREQDTVVDPWFHSPGIYTFNASHDALDIGPELGPLARVEAPTFEARFVWDPALEAWDAAAVAAQNWSLAIASPVYWREDSAPHLVAQLAAAANVIMVTTPLTPDLNPELEVVFRTRNEWIERNAPRVVPLDKMAQAGVFLRDMEGDAKHFQCQFLSQFGSLNEGEFKAPPSGDCHDLLNLNAIMMALAHA